MNDTRRDRGSNSIPGVHVWLVLQRACRAVEEVAKASIDALGMCYADFAILEAILHKGPLPATTIARKVLLTSGSLTAAADRLQERGLVERRPDPDDRRVRMIHLTNDGREVIEAAFEDHRSAMEELASILDDTERAELVRLLKKLGYAAVDMTSESD